MSSAETVSGVTVDATVRLGAVGAFALSYAQRSLSTPARLLRRHVEAPLEEHLQDPQASARLPAPPGFLPCGSSKRNGA